MITIDEMKEANVVVLQPKDKLSGADFKKMGGVIDEKVEQHGKIRVILDMSNYTDPVEYETVMDFVKLYDGTAPIEDVTGVKLKHIKVYECIALICKPLTGLEEWQGLGETLTGGEIRVFTPDQKDEARAWINTACI